MKLLFLSGRTVRAPGISRASRPSSLDDASGTSKISVALNLEAEGDLIGVRLPVSDSKSHLAIVGLRSEMIEDIIELQYGSAVDQVVSEPV